MKSKHALLITLFAAAFSAGPAFAQIPVTDGAHIATSVMNHVEDIAKYVEQIAKLNAQLDQMKQQYDALTGTRNLGAILQDPKFKNYLPEDWQGVYDSVRSGGYSSLSGSAKAIYDAAKKFDACEHVKASDEKAVCQARAVKSAQDKAFAMDAFERAKERLTQIGQLMNSINATDDPKAIAELQGRIAAEQAMIQNEQTKLQMFQMIAAAEDRIQEQQEREIHARTWSARGSIKVTPLTFDK
ncbi:MAG: P-type DNA transfer protein VirB5 [Candidatus Cloacimonetes bacterium]|nr:P-type DNA transfer protein VirB5 [Candidatus Cloacimonadota bacterium]